MSIKDIYTSFYNKLESRKIDMKDYRAYAFNKIKKHELTSLDKLFLAREKNRPKARDFLNGLLDEKLIFKGDRKGGEDPSVIAGIGKIQDLKIFFVAIDKGNSLEEKIERNFGMVSPEGFRKAIRIFKQAEKFKMPLLTIIDTPGAYPGVEAERNGQSNAIASSLLTMSGLKVPVISIITSEGYSGGALSLSLCDYLIMLENSVFSILSPEGFGSIIYRDASKIKEAAKLLKFTAQDMLENGICNEIIGEEIDPLYLNFDRVYRDLRKSLLKNFKDLKKLDEEDLLKRRHRRYDLWG